MTIMRDFIPDKH